MPGDDTREPQDEALAAQLAAMVAEGVRLHQAGRFPDAERIYRRVLDADPTHAEALHLLGVLALQAGQGGEARRLIKESLAANPENADAWNNLGQVLENQGDPDGAEEAYLKALGVFAEFQPAIANLGQLLLVRGRASEATAYLKRAHEADPADAEVLSGLGRALAATGRTDEGLVHLGRAQAMAPHDPGINCNLGVALAAAGRTEDAVAAFERAIAADGAFAEAHYNLGLAREHQGRAESAIQSYRQALAIDPEHVMARVNLGFLFQVLNRIDEAEKCFRQVIAVDPKHAPAHHNLGLALLLQGKLAEGWAEFDWRFEAEGNARGEGFPQPRWQGEDVGGKTILVWGEQGVGDEVMFASIVPDLVERGATVVLECDSRLVPLFERSFGGVACVDRLTPPRPETQATDIDFQSASGSLGRWLRPDAAAFPARPAYLVADAERRGALREKYRGGDDVSLVGIAWHSKSTRIGEAKSMSLADWRPLAAVPGIRLVDLQYGEWEADRDAFAAATGVPVLHDEAVDQLADLDAFAAQIAAMDLVVSVSNTTVHMAGALGVPTWVLLNTVPLACWTLAGDTSPWYSSVRLYRQAEAGEWAGVIERVVADLADL